MSREHVDHSDIARFADERVNLKREDAVSLREQANRLRDRLETYIAEHPDFALRKMLLSGSLAKGTALKSTSDIDVGCYVSSTAAPGEVNKLIPWLAQRLIQAFPNISADQIKPKEYSVAIVFKATGNEVDVVPIIYSGDPQWRGDLVSQDTGERLMTSIPMHLEFIRRRKNNTPAHFAQVVRLLKYWARIQKQADEGFRFKSFMMELVVAHLADKGVPLNDYPNALASAFAFMASDQFRTTIVFSDYYDPATCTASTSPVRIWDPVNCKNNVAAKYDNQNRDKIVEAALDAGDAIDSALRAITKSETVRYWRKVFGPAFDV